MKTRDHRSRLYSDDVPPLTFHLSHRDPTSHARTGTLATPHGSFDTPAFMPVGTQGAMKGILPQQLAHTGAQIMLGNTYHLMLRPGFAVVAAMGGLQHWTRWGRPMLTDSGGFQVFSLAHRSKVTEAGVWFKSHLDGSRHELTPERSMQVQHGLGADIIMAFDECPPAAPPADTATEQATHHTRVLEATRRSARWLARCVASHASPDAQALFGIVQGGTDLDLRAWSVQQTVRHDLPGYAIGGVAVGEPPEEVHRVVAHTAPLLPEDRPRYLMGVGYERDIVAAVRAGVDMFDCVLPTRNGRNASVFTRSGQFRLRNLKFREDEEPIEAGCDCEACTGGFTRAYLRHLFQAGEMLGPILASLHNLRHFQRLMLDIRHAIRHNAWLDFARRWPVAELSL